MSMLHRRIKHFLMIEENLASFLHISDRIYNNYYTSAAEDVFIKYSFLLTSTTTVVTKHCPYLETDSKAFNGKQSGPLNF